MRAFLRLGLAVLLSWSSALSCQICLPYPKDSMLDRLNAAQTLVLARENPDKPYSLSSFRTLRTSVDVPKLDLFLPSSTKRMLEVYPERSILCAWSDGEWQSVCVYKPEMEEVLPQLITNSWGDDRTQRAAFFMDYLSSDELQLSRMAHLEVARAPYSVIRKLGKVVDFSDVRNFLNDARMLEWHGLYILLLAQSGEERDLALIKSRYQQCVIHQGVLQSAAWTLAYLETDKSALDEIKRDYFDNSEHTELEVDSILSSLSAFGEARNEMQPSIAEVYEVSLARFPSQLSKRIDDLYAWKQWQTAEAVKSAYMLEQEQMSVEHINKVRAFLGEASESYLIEQEDVIEQKGGLPLWLCSLPLLLIAGLTYSKMQKLS